MTDLARVKSNVASMVNQGAPEADIDAYIAAEGATLDQIRAAPAAAPANTAPPKGTMQYVDDAVRALANGATFGFADKLAAAGNTALSGGTYEENLKKQQEQSAAIAPAINVPGEIAGSVAGLVAGAPIVRGIAGAVGAAIPEVTNVASKIPSAIKTLAGGAALGGIAGSNAGDNATGAAIGAAAGASTAGVLSGAGKLLGAAGDKILTSVIRPTARDIADGFSLDTIKRFNLGGSLNTTYQKTQAALGTLAAQLREKLNVPDAPTINLPAIVEQTRNELTSAGKLKGFGANQKISAALDNLSEEAKIVGDNLSIPDAQIVKQASGSFGAWQYGRPDPDAKATEVVFNTFYNKLKTAIENASPAWVKEINQDISKLIPINNALIRRMPVAERNYMLSLSDMVGLAASTAHPSGLGLTLLNMAQKSGTVGNALSGFGPTLQKTAAPSSVLSGFGASILGRNSLGQ